MTLIDQHMLAVAGLAGRLCLTVCPIVPLLMVLKRASWPVAGSGRSGSGIESSARPEPEIKQSEPERSGDADSSWLEHRLDGELFGLEVGIELMGVCAADRDLDPVSADIIRLYAMKLNWIREQILFDADMVTITRDMEERQNVQ